MVAPAGSEPHLSVRRRMALSKFYLLRLVLLAGIIQAAQIGLVALITRNLGTTISGLFAKPVAVLLPLIVRQSSLPLHSIGLACASSNGGPSTNSPLLQLLSI